MSVYVLNEKREPVETNPIAWDEARRKAATDGSWRVERTDIGEGIVVSTVFTGISVDPDRKLLFESSVFGGPLHETSQRYESWDAAIVGHANLERLVREWLRRSS